MQIMNDSSRYGSVSQWLHWTTVALVIVLLVMGNAFEIETDEPGSALFFWHGSLGMLVFILAAARVGWLFFSRPPALPQTTSRLFRVLARGTHIALYALLFALPLSGWLDASSEGAGAPFFGLATVPAWRGSPQGLKELHEVLANALLVLASLHVLAALKHHFVNHDDILRRMLPRSRAGSHPSAREQELT